MLILTPKPHPTECISGYLYQLSKANRYDRPSWIIEPYRNGYHADDYRRITPTVMQEIANLTVDEARRVCVRPDRVGDRTTLRLVGTELHASYVDMRSFRICPHCVAQQDRHEAFWHLRLVEWCPIHQVRLLTHCQVCGHQLRWNRPGIGRCSCGADLTVQASPERCESRLSGLLLVFRRALYGSEYVDTRVPDEMSHLLHIDLYRLTRMVEVLGNTFYWQRRRNKKEMLLSVSLEERKVKIDLLEVAKILVPWPISFREALRTYFDKQLSDADARKSFRFAFPWLEFALGRNLREHAEQLAFLREEAARFGATYWTRNQLKRGAGARITGENYRWGSVPDAAEVMGVDPRTLLKRIREGVVPVKESAIYRRSRNYKVDLKWAKDQKCSAHPEVKIRSASAMLGLSPDFFSILLAEQFYRPMLLTRRQGHFAIEDIRRFKGQLDAVVARYSIDGELGGVIFHGRRLDKIRSSKERARALHVLAASEGLAT
ncbi:TniQ family protein [Thermomonas brevis]|uniref:TniQ family protein n=1 Tax=Thermomonas brevis TaxID=215691 RepID=A0A7G9QQ46_9GAMM|nr:TniQ family protein [Thermomonas brevis]QNN45471.1 TniQ family protein [Thermomonas brevis]